MKLDFALIFSSSCFEFIFQDTERLDLFGIDMSKLRSKDLQGLIQPVPTNNKPVNTRKNNNKMSSTIANYNSHINRNPSSFTSTTFVSNSCGKSVVGQCNELF